MNELITQDNINIQGMIHIIRGKEVILDSDLAKLYHCTNGTKEINQAVKRNIDRFDSDFYFQLTDEEKNYLWSQTVTANNMTRTNPYVFTEMGVSMLSGVLHTKTAIETSKHIMRAFVAMRHYIFENKNSLEQSYINNLVLEDHNDIKLLKETLNNMEEKERNNKLFFEGQIYDAYSMLISILNNSKEEIIIIDNYAGKELLDILKSIDRKIIIISKNIDTVLEKKYKNQYKNVTFISNNTFHDRFIILDKKELFTCGASFKDLGKKCFAINEIDDEDILKNLLNKIDNGE